LHLGRYCRVFLRLRGQLIVAALVVSGQLGQAAPAIAAPAAPPSGPLVRQMVSNDDPVRLSLPVGSRQCPASGPSASCNSGDSATPPTPGLSSLPAGQDACPTGPGTAVPHAPAACNNNLLPTPQPSTPVARLGSPAFTQHTVTPSVPSWTLTAAGSQPRVRLEASVAALKSGQSAVLTATASLTMTGTRSAIEIFDQTTGTLVGACMQASQCLVAYTALSGVHTFVAYLTPPVASQPTQNAIASNPVSVSWFSLSIAAVSAAMVSPGKPITVTATTTADVSNSGYKLSLYDQSSGTRLTYCSRGTTCSTTLTKAQAGSRLIVAFVSDASETSPPSSIQAQSSPITTTWLGVTLDANTTHPQRGNTVFMRATANIDVTNTPWSIGIYDENNELVSDACKTGSSCTARVSITTGSTPWFTAVIGAARPIGQSSSSALAKLVTTVQTHASLLNIQVRSSPVQPTRLLWGVDSCKPFTADGKAAHGLYPTVTHFWGSPDFWGRYLTNTYNCPGISNAEIVAAATKQMGILPIYNNYDCSAVRGYNVGLGYASEAAAAAANLGIPNGTVLAVDIEPYGEQCPGAANVDGGFILGWFDGITLAGYAPMYYGNGTAGTEFALAWCRAVTVRPDVAMTSYLWSFEPSLVGRFTKARAPQYSPLVPACTANVAAWQYMLSPGGRVDVDSDEAISQLPLWFPKAAT
jgi:hypothetical protein